MAEKNGSHVQQNMWKKSVEETRARMEGWQADYATLEAKGFEQAAEAIDESAKIMKASFDLAADLSSAWRALATETLRKSAEMMTPRI